MNLFRPRRPGLAALLVLLSSSLSGSASPGTLVRKFVTASPSLEPEVSPGPLFVKELADGSRLVVGPAGSAGSQLSAVRYAPSGARLSAVLLEMGTILTYPAVALGEDGSVFVTSETPQADGFPPDIRTMRFDCRTGKPVWRAPAVFAGAAGLWDRPVAVAVDRSGNVVVAGTTGTTGAGPLGIKSWVTLSYSGLDGSLRFPPVILDGAPDGSPTVLTLDTSGDAIVSGVLYDSACCLPVTAVWTTVRYSASSGALVWRAPDVPVAFSESFGWPPYVESFGPKAVGLDVAGNVFVTGGMAGQNGRLDFVTYKFAAATGTLLWGPVRVDGQAGSDDAASALAVDGLGNVYVTGWSYLSQSLSPARQSLLLKLDGATGSVLWGPVAFDTMNEIFPRSTLHVREDRVVVVVVDGVGPVPIFCFSSGDGALLWGPAGSLTGWEAPATSVDSSGSLLVAGRDRVAGVRGGRNRDGGRSLGEPGRRALLLLLLSRAHGDRARRPNGKQALDRDRPRLPVQQHGPARGRRERRPRRRLQRETSRVRLRTHRGRSSVRRTNRSAASRSRVAHRRVGRRSG